MPAGLDQVHVPDMHVRVQVCAMGESEGYVTICGVSV